MDSTGTRSHPPVRRPSARPPALLADVTWYGTLAAVRDLGSRGVPITLACDARLAPARWSRYVTSAVRCPSTRDHDRFLDWLDAFGARSPGHVLYPTSDDAAWIIATNLAALASKYRLYSPPADALATLLDKSRLSEAARGAGLGVCEMWRPEHEADVERIAREAPFPLLVKPRTQLMGRGGFKGRRVDRPQDLVRVWKASHAPERRNRKLAAAILGVGRPLIMKWYPASETVFTVDGFLDRSGRMVALGCRKMLQWPRRLGPGIMFEGAPVAPALHAGLRALFTRAGYFGVFDAEFVTDGEQLLLIDVNPRFYNHMAFEVARGLPLPWLAYLSATGQDDLVSSAMSAVPPAATGTEAYVHRLPTALMLAFQGMAGTMSDEQRSRWREWRAAHAGHITDPAHAPDDSLPGLADIAFHVAGFLRHPRAFLRDLYRDDAAAPWPGAPPS